MYVCVSVCLYVCARACVCGARVRERARVNDTPFQMASASTSSVSSRCNRLFAPAGETKKKTGRQARASRFSPLEQNTAPCGRALTQPGCITFCRRRLVGGVLDPIVLSLFLFSGRGPGSSRSRNWLVADMGGYAPAKLISALGGRSIRISESTWSSTCTVTLCSSPCFPRNPRSPKD